MTAAIKIAVVLLLFWLAYLLTHRALPFLFVRIGRIFGFSMRVTPLTERRLRRFRGIRRGYWCWVGVTTAFVLSLFLELAVNHKALYIRYGDRIQLPAVAEWLNAWVPFVDLPETARAEDFGLSGEAELSYRDFARWLADPEELSRDAEAIERRLAEDEARFRARIEEKARQAGAEPDPSAALPDFKIEEYEVERAKAAALRELAPLFASGEVGILMPVHPYSPDEQLLTLPGPPPHRAFTKGIPLLGTDFQGKEVVSQLLYGFRTSFAFAVLVAFVGYAIGIAVGAVMGFFGGWIDIGTQRFIEVWSSIPFLFVLMIVGSIFSPSFVLLVVMLVVLVAWIGITYTIRGEFYREKARDYVQAARAVGVGNAKIMAKHILPNSLVPVVTFLPFAIVGNISTLVSLDYLGFGLPPDMPSWGRLLLQGAENVSLYPELVYYPVAAFAITLFSVVMIGEAVREAFDPKVYSRLR